MTNLYYFLGNPLNIYNDMSKLLSEEEHYLHDMTYNNVLDVLANIPEFKINYDEDLL